MNRGADLRVPRFVGFVIRYVTPTFLITILVMWGYSNLPDYLAKMNPAAQGIAAERAAYTEAVGVHFQDAGLDEAELVAKVEELLGPEGPKVDVAAMPAWLQQSRETAEKGMVAAADDARIARLVFVGILLFFLFLIALSDIACRNRIGTAIAQAERAGTQWGRSP